MTTLIRRRKLYEEVADRIEDMIRSGRFRPGDSLPSERELSEMFGVGRNAVREALFALQKIGIVNVELRDIEKLWDADVPDGKRLVVKI